MLFTNRVLAFVPIFSYSKRATRFNGNALPVFVRVIRGVTLHHFTDAFAAVVVAVAGERLPLLADFDQLARRIPDLLAMTDSLRLRAGELAGAGR